jgi:hypothetical protein
MLLVSHDSRPAIVAAAVVEPEVVPELPVSAFSRSRLISFERFWSWYAISDRRPALFTASVVPDTLAVFFRICVRLPGRVVATAASAAESSPSMCALSAAAARESTCHSVYRAEALPRGAIERNGVWMGEMS